MPIRESTVRGDNATANTSYQLATIQNKRMRRTSKKPSLFSYALENVRPAVDRPKTTVQYDGDNHAREKVTQEAGTRLNQVQKNTDHCYGNDRTTDK